MEKSSARSFLGLSGKRESVFSALGGGGGGMKITCMGTSSGQSRHSSLQRAASHLRPTKPPTNQSDNIGTLSEDMNNLTSEMKQIKSMLLEVLDRQDIIERELRQPAHKRFSRSVETVDSPQVDVCDPLAGIVPLNATGRQSEVFKQWTKSRRSGIKALSPKPNTQSVANSLSQETGSDEEENTEVCPGNEDEVFNQKITSGLRFLATRLPSTGSGVILPDDMTRRTVDVFYILCCLVEAIEVGSSLTWYRPFSTLELVCLKSLFTIIHFCFIVAVSRTAILEGYVLEDRSLEAIRTVYRSSWLVFDVLTAAPVDLFCVLLGSVGISRIVATARILHFVRIPSLLATANPLKKATGWHTVLKTIFWGLWCLNIIALAFISIDGSGLSDIESYDGDGKFDVYLQGLWWATITISTVGYGDVIPKNRWSRMFAVPVVLLSVLFVSFLTGRIASSVIRLDAFENLVEERKAKLYSLMARYQVPWEIQKEAFSIYPALLESSLKDYFDLLLDLPPFMQEKVIFCIKRKIVSQVPLFCNANEKTLTALAMVTQQVLVGPNEFIIEAGQIGYEMYFIAQGVVEVLIKDEDGGDFCAATLQSGSWFGEIALLKHTERTASVRSVTACSCFKLLKQDFSGILKCYPAFETQMVQVVEARLQENLNEGSFNNQSANPLSPDARQEFTDIADNITESNSSGSEYVFYVLFMSLCSL